MNSIKAALPTPRKFEKSYLLEGRCHLIFLLTGPERAGSVPTWHPVVHYACIPVQSMSVGLHDKASAMASYCNKYKVRIQWQDRRANTVLNIPRWLNHD